MSKNTIQNSELQRDHSIETLGNFSSSLLKKHQGQKWQQIFDFDNILKQIRTAEKLHLKGKHDVSNSKSNSFGDFYSAKNVHVKNCRQIKQVLRLNGNDMHYYGIVPKTKAENVVVCNICMGIYTKIGFNNHMMLQHPTIWSSVSTKINSEIINEFQNISNNLQESSNNTDLKAILPKEIQPIDVDILSTNNLNNTIKSGLSIISGSENSNCSSNNKQNHNNSPCTSLYSTVDGFTEDSLIDPTLKSSTYSTQVDINLKDAAIALSTNSMTTERQIKVMPYSSSSNSSSSFPTTPKTLSNFSEDMSANKINDLIKVTQEEHLVSSCSTNQKIKSPIYPESEYIESPKSNSSNECVASSSSSTLLLKSTKNDLKPNSAKKITIFSKQKCIKKYHSGPQAKANIDQLIAYKKNIRIKHSNELYEHISHESNNSKAQATVKIVNNLDKMSSEMKPQNTEIMISEKSIDENLLTLEDVLDSKFINDILSTTDSEMNFDENELNSEIHQIYFPIPNKKMRFDKINREQSYITDVSPEITIYQNNNNENNISNKNKMQIITSGILLKEDQNVNFQQMTCQQNLKLYNDNNNVIHENTCLNKEIENRFINKFQKRKSIDSKFCDLNSDYEDNKYDSISKHFKIFKIPSMTDDMTEEMIMPNFTKSRSIYHYIFSSFNANLASEISVNNEVPFINQQKQQESHTKLSNQRSLNNIEVINNSNLQEPDIICNKLLNETAKFFIVDHMCIDKIRTLQSFSNNTPISSNLNVQNGIKIEGNSANALKLHEEYFSNIFMYSGAPLPITINSFGIVKFPQSIATTTRKNLLSRKANNNPITFNSGVNGIVCSSTTTSVFSNPNIKSVPNFLSSISGKTINSSTNEFSIGSIVITNPIACSQHQNYILPKQNACGQIEIVLNGSTNGHLMMPLQPNRIKVNSAMYNHSNGNSNGFINLRSKVNCQGGITTQSIHSDSSRAGPSPQDLKTISVSNTINSLDRIKFSKKKFITKHDISKRNNFSAKLLNEMLSDNCKSFSKTCEKNFGSFDSESNRLKPGRIILFNNRRKKVLMNALREQFHEVKQKTNLQILMDQSSEYAVNNISKFKNSNNEATRIIV